MKKNYSAIAALFIAGALFSQPCHKLFFSEYVKGSGNRKAVEIYNPTSAAVSLSGYRVSVFSNGSNSPSLNFNLNATLAAGDVYVIANSQADSMFKLLADTLTGGLAFTGNDAVALLFGTDTVDVIGIIGNDPGSGGWAVDTASTSNHTLIRKPAVQQAANPWDTSEWYTLAKDTVRLGEHTGPTGLTPCTTSNLDTLVTFLNDSGTFTGVNGNYSAYLILNLLHTDSMAVDVELTSGNAAWINNYTTQTISFASGVIQKTFSLTITNDTTGGVTNTLQFKLVNASTGLTIGEDSVFTLLLFPPVVAPEDTCATLFFSEYVEGSANNKALEIYNPTANAVSLANYKVVLFVNGNTTPTNTLNLSGSLAAGDVYVIVSSQADSTTKLLADTTSNVTNFNGNDALALLYFTDTLDVIGVVGTDPGSNGWTVGSGSAVNHTLVRDSTVKKGNTNWAVAVNQWNVFGMDTFFLGTHTGPVNQNACVLVSGIKEEINTTNQVRIYPNPNHGNFTVELLDGNHSDTEVKIFDLSGRVLYAAKGYSNILSINTPTISAGIYVVETRSGKQYSRSKITIQ